MNFNENKRDIFGQVFFALSVIFLAYMFINPLNQIIFNIDEYLTLTITNLPIHDILTVTSNYVHPPLYFLMGKIALKVFGIAGISSIFALKILSMIPYILILVISFIKIREEYDWLTAGLFSFSIIVASEFFTYFLMARMYSWAILFTLLTFVYFKEILAKDDVKSYILFTAFSILGSYTHYFCAIASICLYAILLSYIMKHDKDKLKYWAISLAASIIVYVPWMPSLINQLSSVHKSFWIPQVTLSTIIQSLGYFANTDMFFSIIAIVILIVIAWILSNEVESLDKIDQYYILAGFGVYIGTIALAMIISIVFKPILVTRYLLPATAVLWLTISIVLSKIHNKKMFLISFALICLLLVSGIGTTIATSNSNYDSGIVQKEAFDKIIQDNNSSVILTTPKAVAYFLTYSNQTDMHCTYLSHLMGDPMDRILILFDLDRIAEGNATGFIENNTSKNIYLISLGENDLNVTSTPIYQSGSLDISKVNMTNTANDAENPEEYEY